MCATVLYLSYTGLLEPLGQSQVYQYLRSLSNDHDIHLLTYEKPSDLAQKSRVSEMKHELERQGIEWHPFRYHKSPTVPATLWDIARGVALGAYLTKRHNIDVLHARSYIAGAIAMAIDAVSSTKFIFDMRGFWADERVDAGMWSEDSRLYSWSKTLERQLFERADVIVSLTNAGIDAIKGFSHVDTSDTEFTMIPTCVNLDLFTPAKGDTSDEPTLCYLGSVGTWYLFEDVLDCFSILREFEPNATLKVINQGDHQYIRDQLEDYEIPASAVDIQALEHQEVPAALSDVDAGIFFYKPTFSKKGTSPTKLGEFLAAGIPCLTNYGVGDVQELLEGNDVGVVTQGFEDDYKRRAINDLQELITEDGIKDRCRAVAEDYYSLEEGVAKYDELYRRLSEAHS